VNRTINFKVICNIYVKVAFERGITQKMVKHELSFLLSPMLLIMQMIYFKYNVKRTFIGNIKFHDKAMHLKGA
jgi:hypothetical protein